MRVVWTATALRGVARIYDYLSEFNPQAARLMADALLSAGDSLVHFPHRGRPVANSTMRELVSVPPYIIRYRIARDEVMILRIRHGARRPSAG